MSTSLRFDKKDARSSNSTTAISHICKREHACTRYFILRDVQIYVTGSSLKKYCKNYPCAVGPVVTILNTAYNWVNSTFPKPVSLK